MRKTLLIALLMGLTVAACSGRVSDVPSALPVSVVGSDGRTLTLEEPAGRIVSLSATHTEMLYAVGAEEQIAATDLTSNYPPDAETTVKVDAFNFSIEQVAAVDPDLVVLAFDFQGEIEALERVRIPSLLLEPAVTLEEAYNQVLAIGYVSGHQEEAERLVEQMRSETASIVESAPAFVDPPLVYHEVDATLFSPNSASLPGDLYRRFGLLNIADEVPDESGSGYVQLSAEFIIDSDPTIIFLGDAAFGESADSLSARPGWCTLTALRMGHVFELEPDISGRWGPRSVDLAAVVAAALVEVAG